MSEEQFSPEESLQLIRTMIDKTKSNISSDSIYFLVWGWLTFIACLGQFFLKHVFQYPKHYLVWWVVPFGIVISVYLGIRERHTKKVKTYVDDSMKYLWLGMAISFFILAMILAKIGWDSNVFPFYILFYGLGTFVSGCFLQFKPLIFGGIIAWVLALIAVQLEYDYQILAAAAALLLSYIVPGHILQTINVRNAKAGSNV